MNNELNREQTAGRFAPRGMDSICKCGHTLGGHDAARERFEGVTYQDCQHDGCECECYKRDTKATKAAKAAALA